MADNTAPAPHVDTTQTAALPAGEVVVRFSTPEQVHLSLIHI